MKNYFAHRLHCFIFFILIFSVGCKKNDSATAIVFSEKYTVNFCAKEIAGELISTDTLEHFFDYVQDADMALQMKDISAPENISHENKIIFYKNFLKNSTGNFSEKEKNILINIFSELFSLCEKCGVKTLPKKINLIKTKVNSYGNTTFFTRIDAIIIPEKSLTLDREFILQTMLHEVSHILLRYNPVLKNKLFSIIGFEKITTGKSDNFNNRKNLITNPDAVGYTYFWRVPKQFNLADTAVNFYLYCDTSEIKKNNSAEYFEILKTGILNKNFQDIPNFDLRAVHTYFGIDYLLQPDEIIAVYFSSFIYGCKNPEILKDTSPFVAQIGKMVCNF